MDMFINRECVDALLFLKGTRMNGFSTEYRTKLIKYEHGQTSG